MRFILLLLRCVMIGHFVPDTVYDALDKLLPGLLPAEGAGCLCNFQVSVRPRSNKAAPSDATRAEVLMFNSGGSGARPNLDGMNATALPSGVMTMPVEATEQVGPVIIWRKELRPDSGGLVGIEGLGQFMEVGVQIGHEFDLQAMFDRVQHPARGRRGGSAGAPTTIQQMTALLRRVNSLFPGSDGKDGFPGGGGYGDPRARDMDMVRHDLIGGYITAEKAAQIYGLDKEEIAAL